MLTETNNHLSLNNSETPEISRIRPWDIPRKVSVSRADSILIKTCCHCKQEKTLDEFYKNRSLKDGLSVECKQCHKRYLSPEMQRLKRHTPQGKAAFKRYYKTKKHKVTQAKSAVRHRVLHPDRMKARWALSRAVVAGRLPCAKKLRCIRCAKPSCQWHHHISYAPENWVDVIPMCTLCHAKEHRIAV